MKTKAFFKIPIAIILITLDFGFSIFFKPKLISFINILITIVFLLNTYFLIIITSLFKRNHIKKMKIISNIYFIIQFKIYSKFLSEAIIKYFLTIFINDLEFSIFRFHHTKAEYGENGENN